MTGKRWVAVETGGGRWEFRSEDQLRTFLETRPNAQPVYVSVIGLAQERWVHDAEQAERVGLADIEGAV